MNKCLILFLATALTAFAGEPELKFSLLEDNVLCVRTGQVPENFAEQVQAGQPTNRISGVILDLRFADGGKNIAAGNLFAGRKIPLVILVNGQTQGGAAELVTQLRAENRAIVIGGTNATGKIAPDIAISANSQDEKKFQEDPFAKTADNGNAFGTTNGLLPFVDHMSEAELVNKRAKDGELDEPDMPRAEPLQPVIRDPALARAMDLFKALAVLNKPRG